MPNTIFPKANGLLCWNGSGAGRWGSVRCCIFLSQGVFLHFSISCAPVYCKLQHAANVSITVYFTLIFFFLQITLIRTVFSQQILRNTIKTQEHLMPRLCLSLRHYVICSFPMQICCQLHSNPCQGVPDVRAPILESLEQDHLLSR